MNKCARKIPELRTKKPVHLAMAGGCGHAYSKITWKLKTHASMLSFPSVPDAIQNLVRANDSVCFV